MKRRFTYRELTLVIGVVVALVVGFTLLGSPMKTSDAGTGVAVPVPAASVAKAVASVLLDASAQAVEKLVIF